MWGVKVFDRYIFVIFLYFGVYRTEDLPKDAYCRDAKNEFAKSD